MYDMPDGRIGVLSWSRSVLNIRMNKILVHEFSERVLTLRDFDSFGDENS